MRSYVWTTGVVAAAALLMAGCGAGTTKATSTPSSSQTGSPAAHSANWPYSGTLPNGTTFKLADSVAKKIRVGEQINYVFSYAASGRSLFSSQSLAGYKVGLADGNKVYPMKGNPVAPAEADNAKQIAQVEALYNSGQLDCLSVAVSDATSFSAEVNRLVSAGIPVFTVGAPTQGNQLANFTQIPEKEGAQAAQVVLDWMKANNKTLTTFAVSGGNPSASWAQGRLTSFIDTIKAAIPDAKFVNNAGNALNTSFDPAKTFEAYNAFLAGHKDVQFILNVDQGAGQADRAIKEAGLEGKAYTIGWNLSPDQLDGVEQGIQVAVLDQRWDDQAAYGGRACAAFFKNGEILPNTQKLTIVQKDGVAAARQQLQELLGS